MEGNLFFYRILYTIDDIDDGELLKVRLKGILYKIPYNTARLRFVKIIWENNSWKCLRQTATIHNKRPMKVYREINCNIRIELE